MINDWLTWNPENIFQWIIIGLSYHYKISNSVYWSSTKQISSHQQVTCSHHVIIMTPHHLLNNEHTILSEKGL
jgi:hypothetical protein